MTTSTIAPSIPVTIDPNKDLLDKRRMDCEELLRTSTSSYEPGGSEVDIESQSSILNLFPFPCSFAGTYCPGQFDSWSCFVDTPIKTVAKVPCPPFFEFDTSREYIEFLIECQMITSMLTRAAISVYFLLLNKFYFYFTISVCSPPRIRTQDLYGERRVVPASTEQQNMDKLHDMYRC